MLHQGISRRWRIAITAVATSTLAALALAGCAGTPSNDGSTDASNPVNLRMASYVGERSGSLLGAYDWADKVTEATNGDVTFEWFISSSLFPATEHLAGIGSGAADGGVMTHGYYASQLPLTHILNLGFSSSNYQALWASMDDMWEDYAPFRAEWEGNNIRPIMWSLLATSVLGCNKPITSIADLKGKNVRAAALITEDFTSIGANVVALGVTDVLDAFQRGVIDCWAAFDLTIANDSGVLAVTPYLYNYDRGPVGAAELVLNVDVWNTLTDAQQKIMLDTAADVRDGFYSKDGPLAGVAAEACKTVKDNDVKASTLSDAAVKEWAAIAGPANLKKYLQITGAQGQPFLDRITPFIEEHTKEFSDFADPTLVCFD